MWFLFLWCYHMENRKVWVNEWLKCCKSNSTLFCHSLISYIVKKHRRIRTTYKSLKECQVLPPPDSPRVDLLFDIPNIFFLWKISWFWRIFYCVLLELENPQLLQNSLYRRTTSITGRYRKIRKYKNKK